MKKQQLIKLFTISLVSILLPAISHGNNFEFRSKEVNFYGSKLSKKMYVVSQGETDIKYFYNLTLNGKPFTSEKGYCFLNEVNRDAESYAVNTDENGVWSASAWGGKQGAVVGFRCVLF